MGRLDDKVAVITGSATGMGAATARRFGVTEERLFDPEENLEAGTRYLKWLRDRYADDLPRILAAYNAGEANVDRYGGVPPFRETRTYIERIYSTLGVE